MLFGQLGDDTIQGDGAIAPAFARAVDNAGETVLSTTVVTTHASASRSPDGCTGPAGALVCDYVGDLDTVPVVRGDDGRRGLHRGQRRERHGLRQPRPGRHPRWQLGLLQPDDRPPAPGRQRPPVRRRRHAPRAQRRHTTAQTGTTAADVHARDADTLVGDNGRIIRIVGVNGTPLAPTTGTSPRWMTFNYDTYDGTGAIYDPNKKIVVRGVTLIDYTPGGPDFDPIGVRTAVNGPAYCHDRWRGHGRHLQRPAARSSRSATAARPARGSATSAATTRSTASPATTRPTAPVANDVLYGDAQDDDLIGGWGNDWISGRAPASTASSATTGRLFTSRNSATGVSWNNATGTWRARAARAASRRRRTASTSRPRPASASRSTASRPFVATDPDPKTSQGFVLNEFIYTPGQVQTATINVATFLAKSVDETPYNLGPNDDGQGHLILDLPLFDANNSDDIIFGGWDDDFLHGGSATTRSSAARRSARARSVPGSRAAATCRCTRRGHLPAGRHLQRRRHPHRLDPSVEPG
jgi:hypothetical protein